MKLLNIACGNRFHENWINIDFHSTSKKIKKEYIDILNKVINDPSYNEKYDWIVIELLDQMVRTKPGGSMLEMYEKIKNQKNQDMALYIKSRVGEDLLNAKKLTHKRIITLDKIKNKLLYTYLKLIRFLIPPIVRDMVFINTSIGERHNWMYDRYSLSKLLSQVGFRDPTIMSFDKSNIPNFNNYYLDINPDGSPYKGESSLYMEAFK